MMNNELRPYEGYKPTNLPWLDEIPKHWSLSRNKNVMIQNKSLVGLNHTQYKLLSLTLNGVIARDMVNPKGKFPKEFDTYQVVSEKNLVFCLFDIDETPRTVGISPMDGMITGAYTVLKVANANERFLYYYYLSIDNNKMLKPLYTGLRKVISADTFLRTKLPIPPRPEQDQIVKYLDHKLFKINKFIKAKKKLIAVLKEQKQAIINEAVTKGLDPNVKMKPSGVEWLGDVPEHWECKRIKSVLNNVNENTTDNTEKQYVGMENIESWSGKVINLDPNFKFESQAKIFRDGDVLFGKLRPYLAKVATANFSGVCSGEFLVLRPIQESMLSQYIENVLRSKKVIDLITSSTYGAKMPRAEWNFIGNIKIFIPPTSNEQMGIGERLSASQNSVDDSISTIENEIQLITEYKNSLISDVVTGKIDVRHIIIDETEEIVLEELELDEDSGETEEILENEEGDE